MDRLDRNSRSSRIITNLRMGIIENDEAEQLDFDFMRAYTFYIPVVEFLSVDSIVSNVLSLINKVIET